MTKLEKLELIHKMYRALNTHDIEAHDTYWTKDMIWHGPPGWDDVHGREAFEEEVLRPFFKAFPDYYAINYIELVVGTMYGLDEFENKYRKAFIHAFPDKHAIDIVRISEGDRVAGTGYQDTTFAETWLGIPPTGKKIRMRYLDFWRIETDGETGERKLAENLVLIDIFGVLEQAGYNVNNVLKFIGSHPPEYFDEAG